MSTPKRPEIDERTMKLIVGVVALGLPILTKLTAQPPLPSISDSYWHGGLPQTIFVGCLFAIGSFLTAYNGLEPEREMILSKVAAAAALCVALFPCACDGHTEAVPGLHYVAATFMFVALAVFCRHFYQRAMRKHRTEARRRARVYFACGLTIVLSMLLLVVNAVPGTSLEMRFPNIVFFGETAALDAFGVSWLMASHVVPWFNDPEKEQFSPFRKHNPPQEQASGPQNTPAAQGV